MCVCVCGHTRQLHALHLPFPLPFPFLSPPFQLQLFLVCHKRTELLLFWYLTRKKLSLAQQQRVHAWPQPPVTISGRSPLDMCTMVP